MRAWWKRGCGAAILAVSAANRMGAGYVRAYVCEEAARILHAVQPSVVTLPASDYASGSQPDERHPLAAVVGCGMRVPEELRLVVDVLESTDAPVLVDGGGLAALGTPAGLAALKRRFVEGFLRW
ncbi:MAG: NAD(P)H-hydrate dehydratase [Eggerthellaceae bacterium]